MNGAIVIFQNVEKQSDRQETWVQYLTHNNSLIKSDWETWNQETFNLMVVSAIESWCFSQVCGGEGLCCPSIFPLWEAPLTDISLIKQRKRTAIQLFVWGEVAIFCCFTDHLTFPIYSTGLSMIPDKILIKVLSCYNSRCFLNVTSLQIRLKKKGGSHRTSVIRAERKERLYSQGQPNVKRINKSAPFWAQSPFFYPSIYIRLNLCLLSKLVCKKQKAEIK